VSRSRKEPDNFTFAGAGAASKFSKHFLNFPPFTYVSLRYLKGIATKAASFSFLINNPVPYGKKFTLVSDYSYR
jgi:hypothetical protein